MIWMAINENGKWQRKGQSDWQLEMSKEYLKYIHIYSGAPKEERAHSGVMLAVIKQYIRNIKSRNYINNQILQVEMEIKGQFIVFITGYVCS